jgi:hypothetical protein
VKEEGKEGEGRGVGGQTVNEGGEVMKEGDDGHPISLYVSSSLSLGFSHPLQGVGTENRRRKEGG